MGSATPPGPAGRKPDFFLYSKGVRSQIGISGFARNADLGSDPLRIKKCPAFLFSEGGSRPPSENKKARLFLFRGEKKVWAGPGPPGQSLAWSQGLPASPWPGPSPAQNVGSGPNHQKWPELGPESTVWPETWSRSMPGPFRSLWDGSNPLQGAVPGEKSQKVCPSRPRISRSIHNPW